MTAREAYDCDSTFRLLVDEWVRGRRCPRPLVDRCLELDLDGAADCARWAATEPERNVYMALDGQGELDTPCGPFPSLGFRPWDKTLARDTLVWYWRFDGSSFASTLPDRMAHLADPDAHPRAHLVSIGRLCSLDAILWLLDAWVPESVVESCCVCGKPATTNYDDREDAPSCGAPGCELRMQVAFDYIAEAGDR